MSLSLISQYYSKVDKLIQFGGTKKETSVRNAFYYLLEQYADKKNLVLVAELPVRGTKGRDVTPDGTLKNILRLDYGLWESKDESLFLDDEIDKKIKKGYPLNNILFEDSNNAVLFQGSQEVMRINMRNPDELDRILNAFVNFKNPLVKKYEEAILQFQQDIPTILETLRDRIDQARSNNQNFISVSETFLELCKSEINPDITMADVREMMIQHILTSDIFNKIFDDPEFHRHNNIANELEKLIGTLFNYSERKNLLGSIEHYYDAINAAAASVADHHEKQKFLKALYENFYKAYNPKAADRLGVVYTPNEIVDFMIDSTNYLLEKHFKRVLWDKNVDILDPATGTGTFICNMIDKCPNQSLAHKYKYELHANEVAILPYYVSNLNIEFIFKQKMGYYEEFRNLCFVDTLDNTDALAYSGKQHSLFGLSSENSRRINEQNARKISVIIGNPPYNANQKNENENNKNRTYLDIDKRIKETFVKHSNAQKTKVYDMYSRFFRWAFDRINTDGIITFISNNSFTSAEGFDGFRKVILDEFSECFIIDFAGDLRTDKEENIFGITVGVCITFLIKRGKLNFPCEINYFKVPYNRKNQKIEWLRSNPIETISFEKIRPNNNSQWMELVDNDFEGLLPLINKKGKSESIIYDFSNGLSSNRDEWVYDFAENTLYQKAQYFISEYNHEVKRWIEYKTLNNYSDIKAESNPIVDDFLSDRNLIKWSKMIKRDKLRKGKIGKFEKSDIRHSLYRPFVNKYLFFGYIPIDMRGSFTVFYPDSSSDNATISISTGQRVRLSVIASKLIADLNMFSPAPVLSFSKFRYNEKGERQNNITDWGLDQFTTHYNNQTITKEDIFHYTYAVLHNPVYRKKYELNLKREFPRIPFYEDFWKWAAWGKTLMDLHINYETVEPYPLEEHNYEVKAEAKRQKEMFTIAEEPQPMFAKKPKVKAKLKADKQSGIIEIDELTLLTGVPREAWEYKLGNRSALEWILDQYKEKKPKDPTIAEKFNTYRFADYKEKVIDLLKRVCRVSVETVGVVKEMEQIKTQ